MKQSEEAAANAMLAIRQSRRLRGQDPEQSPNASSPEPLESIPEEPSDSPRTAKAKAKAEMKREAEALMKPWLEPKIQWVAHLAR